MKSQQKVEYYKLAAEAGDGYHSPAIPVKKRI
jgi:hypothetical protein